MTLALYSCINLDSHQDRECQSIPTKVQRCKKGYFRLFNDYNAGLGAI